jgi:hypothetical protein
MKILKEIKTGKKLEVFTYSQHRNQLMNKLVGLQVVSLLIRRSGISATQSSARVLFSVISA